MTRSWKRQFIIVYAGQAFSILGSAAVQFAVIWWLTVQTESAVTLTIATIVGFLPHMVLGPFAGVWVDRYNRGVVMILADGLVALSSAFLGVVFLMMATPPVWLIYVALFVRGVGSTFHSPAMQAAVPMLVPPEMLTKAGGWGSMIASVSSMAGPVLGAALMGILPVAPIMLVDVLGAAFAIVCLLFVKIPDIAKTAEKPNLGSDMKQGFSAIRQNRPLMAIFFPMVLCNIVFQPLGALYPLLVRTHFAGTAWHNSMAEVVWGGGLLISSMIMGVWGGMKRRFLMISLSIMLMGLSAGACGALPGNGFAVFLVFIFIMGGSVSFANIPMMAYIQSTVAPEQMGKVFSLLTTATTLAMPIGLLAAGPVSEIVGVDRWFLYSGAAVALTGVLCWMTTRQYDVIPAAELPPKGV